MKHIIYIITMTLFLGLLAGCGGGSTPSEDEKPVAMSLSVNPGVDEILLQWNAVDNVAGYILEWGEIQDTLDNTITFDAGQIQYLHQDLEPETIYYYSMIAKYADGQSGEPSKTVAVKTGSVIQIMQSDVAY